MIQQLGTDSQKDPDINRYLKPQTVVSLWQKNRIEELTEKWQNPNPICGRIYLAESWKKEIPIRNQTTGIFVNLSLEYPFI